MNFELEKAWKGLLESFDLDNVERPDVDSILFVIGLQELRGLSELISHIDLVELKGFADQ